MKKTCGLAVLYEEDNMNKQIPNLACTLFLLLELLLKMRLMHISQWAQFIRDGEQSQEILKIILVTLRVMVIDQFILQSLEEMEKELKFKLELKK